MLLIHLNLKIREMSVKIDTKNDEFEKNICQIFDENYENVGRNVRKVLSLDRFPHFDSKVAKGCQTCKTPSRNLVDLQK